MAWAELASIEPVGLTWNVERDLNNFGIWHECMSNYAVEARDPKMVVDAPEYEGQIFILTSN